MTTVLILVALMLTKRISLDQAAERLGVHKRTVRRLVSSGQLPAYRVGNTTVIRIDAEAVDALLVPVVADGKR